MEITDKMGLTKWDDLDDPYDHAQLAANWEAVDEHDHSSGKGVRIPTGGIGAGAVTTPNIADDAVNSAKIIENGVQTLNIQNGAVTADKLDQALFASILPLGTVIAWYRVSGATPVPTGFVICAGGTTASHDFVGGGSIPIPNLVNSFVMGVASGSDEKVAGGANSRSLEHFHYIPDHTHTAPSHVHTLNDHSHTVNSHRHAISTDGAHAHAFNGELHLAQRPYEISDGGTPRQALYLKSFNSGSGSADVEMDAKGNHTHGGFTGFDSPGTGGASTASGGVQITNPSGASATTGVNSFASNKSTTGVVGGLSTDIRPSFTGLLYIMKVRNRTI